MINLRISGFRACFVFFAVILGACSSSSSNGNQDANGGGGIPSAQGGSGGGSGPSTGGMVGSGGSLSGTGGTSGGDFLASCQAYYNDWFAGGACTACVRAAMSSLASCPAAPVGSPAGCEVGTCEVKCGGSSSVNNAANCGCIQACLGNCEGAVLSYYGCVNSKCAAACGWGSDAGAGTGGTSGGGGQDAGHADVAVTGDTATGGTSGTGDGGSCSTGFCSACQAYYNDWFANGSVCHSCVVGQLGTCQPLQTSGSCAPAALAACETKCGGSSSVNNAGNCACIEACLGACANVSAQYYSCEIAPCGSCSGGTGGATSSGGSSGTGGGGAGGSTGGSSGSVADAGDGSACSAVCIGNVADDFLSGALGPHWISGMPACGTVAVADGAISLSRPTACTGNPAAVLDTCNYQVCGDFDLQADFTLVDFAPPTTGHRYVGMNVMSVQSSGFSTTPSWNISIERIDSPKSTALVPALENYKSYTTSSTEADSKYAPTTDASGRFRITRVGTTLTSYYWSNGAWVSLATGTAAAGPVVAIGVYAGGDDPTAEAATFDNVSIVSSP
jgi:hypothetical protein